MTSSQSNDEDTKTTSSVSSYVAPAPAAPEVDEEAQDAKERASAEAAAEQYAKDVQFRNDNPNEPIVRAGAPGVGGEFN